MARNARKQRRPEQVAHPQQAPHGDLDLMHYVNVTTIDAIGGAAHGQIMVNTFQQARENLRAKVNEAAERVTGSRCYHLIIAAYLYDTESKVLHSYRVINHDEHLPTIEEVQ